MKIKRDTLLVLETGEYSDYSFTGPFVVLKDFDEADVIEKHKAQWKPDNDYDDEPDTDSFIAWLSKKRYIEHAANVVSWHIGSYGRLEATPHPEPEKV